jgi:hypothetical protein
MAQARGSNLMAKLTPTAYPSLIDENPAPEATWESRHPPATPPREYEQLQHEGEYLRDVAQQIVAYITPEAHKAFVRFAVERSSFKAKVKPHDLYIEALSDWLKKHGIECAVRAKEPPPRRRKRVFYTE